VEISWRSRKSGLCCERGYKSSMGSVVAVAVPDDE
jgi:hypothetical protein